MHFLLRKTILVLLFACVASTVMLARLLPEVRSSAAFALPMENGGIEGTVERGSFPHEQIVVYAYHAGQYAASEAETSNTERFANAKATAMVRADGTFSLPDLTSGKYQLVFAAYEPNETEWKFLGTFQLNETEKDRIIDVETGVTTTVAYQLARLNP